MLNHLKSHILAYGLAAVVVIFFAGQAILWSWQPETNFIEPQSVEAAVDRISAEKVSGLELKNEQLYAQNNQLSEQNGQLDEQNSQLRHENTQLHQQNGQLRQKIIQLHEVIKEKDALAATQIRELGLRHQQLAEYEQVLEAMKAQTPIVKQAVLKQAETDAGLVKLARETLGVDVEVRECR